MLISVIIPVYNVESYLHQCIDSVLAQTYQDFELLLIDDGSTDGSGAICDAYAAKDARVQVFHQKNDGVSSARNLGIKNAKGEWITFVDGDDWVSEDYLKNLHNNAKSVDLVISALYKIRKLKEIYGKLRYNQLLFTKDELLLNLNNYKLANYGYVFSALFKTTIIKRNYLGFNQRIKYAEDLVFMLEYMMYTSLPIIYSGDCDYFYNLDNENSAIKKKYDFAHNKYFLDIIYDFQVHRLKIDNINEYQGLLETNKLYILRLLESIEFNGNSLKRMLTMLSSISKEQYIYFLHASTLKDNFKYKLLINRNFYSYLVINTVLRKLRTLFK